MTKETKTKAKRDPIVALIRRCDQENPTPEDLARIREHLDQNDTLVHINESSELAFKRVIGCYTNFALSKELFKRQIKAKREDLDYESANAMVKTLIDQVILCHIRLTAFEAWHAEKTKETISLAVGMYFDKLLSSYQKRFHKACESLAKVRKLFAEADLADQKARQTRSKKTLDSQKLYKMLSG